jgi:ABC-type antimicrobial peptide transport system permease subunit
MNEAPEPLIYFSYMQGSGPQTILHLRTQGDPQLAAPALEQAVHQLNAKLPVFDVFTLEQSSQTASMFVLIESTFAGAFALLALILAASGIYGVIAYRTELRTHEIGIRIALGASHGDVLRLVLHQGLRLAIIGIALGLTMSLLLTRFLRGLLYGVSTTDPLTVFSVTAVLALIAVAACYLPAIKAMRIEPVAAMRL